MYKYYCFNAIAECGLANLSEDFVPVSDAKDADGILVRSAALHELEFGKNLKVIARAGAGVNNIPLDRCAEEGIVVFNTPGANANGVKELVIAGMLLASRDILGGINWVQENEEDGNIAKDAEKAKKAFAGCELEGKKLGVIGLGAIGVLVANAAQHLGMDVYGYDPYLSVESAWKISRGIHHARTVDEIYSECDYITIHVPALDSTKGMIDADAIAGVKGAIVIPHLGASTAEAEENCAKMAVKEMRNYLEYGNIKNSVNYPNCDMGYPGDNKRITLLHHNIPNMIGQITGVLAKDNMNIADMSNKSKGSYAYTMIDVDSDIPESVKQDLEAIDGILRVRILN